MKYKLAIIIITSLIIILMLITVSGIISNKISTENLKPWEFIKEDGTIENVLENYTVERYGNLSECEIITPMGVIVNKTNCTVNKKK